MPKMTSPANIRCWHQKVYLCYIQGYYIYALGLYCMNRPIVDQ